MPIEKAKVICEIAQTLINSAKVEVEYIKAVGGKVTSAFIEMQANGKELPEINIEK